MDITKCKFTQVILGAKVEVKISDPDKIRGLSDAFGVTLCPINQIHLNANDFFDSSTPDESKFKFLLKTYRHEIVHMFMYASGLNGQDNGKSLNFSVDETCVDWIAIQFHKLEEVINKGELELTKIYNKFYKIKSRK